MHIAIDARPLSWGPGGIRRICTNLLPAMQGLGDHDLTVYSNSPSEQTPEGCDLRVLPGSLGRYSLRDLPRAVKRSGADVLLSLAPEVVRPVVPSVLVLYDLYALLYAQWLKPWDRLSATYWRQVAAARFRLASMGRLSGVVAISHHSARDLARFRADEHLPVTVAPPAADPVFSSWCPEAAQAHVATVYGLGGQFVLYAGAINAQKNVSCLVTAFRRLHARLEHTDVRLVIVGRPSWPKSKLELAGIEDRVLQLCDLEDRELAALYSACDAFVLPSLYEGFGLPVLEAMVAGAPVLVADTSALPEVVGDAGLLFDPHGPDALSEQLAHVVADPELRGRLRAASRARAAAFSWTGMATTVLEALEVAAHAR